MSNIKPFRALHYNPKKVKNIRDVMCPPYDVISEDEQNHYLQLKHNFINLILGKDKPNDDQKENKYTRAKKTLDDWLKKGVLVQDEKPAIYFYKQEYKILGEKHSRLGFISLLELHEEEDSKVVPHENTHTHAVEDRLKLWKTLSGNLSSIFVCYSDVQRKVEKIFNKHVAVNTPIIDLEDSDKVRHRMWALDDAGLIDEINQSLKNQHIFIADGHHRYKVACEFRRSKLSKKINPTGQEPFNYVMTYFTNIDSKDLQIFPMHRIVKHLSQDMGFLEEHFRIDKIKTREDLLILLGRAGRNEHAFGLYTRQGMKLLRLKNKLLINEFVKEGSTEYRSLDATILKFFVLDRLGVASDDIMYTKDLDEAVDMVENMKADASFIMNPVKITELKAIALNGERMPPKTTYFYPKVLSGLTVYKMD